VTGGSRGLGAAIGEALAWAGADVAITGRTADVLEAKAAAIADLTDRTVVGMVGDVSDPVQVDQVVAQVIDRWGRIDILVNNAGINVRGAIAEIEPKEFDYSLAVNVTGPWLMCRAVEPTMRRAGRGRVVNIASTFGVVGAANRTAYASSKGALVNMTRALALEWASIGVTVNAIAPGPFLTDMNIPFVDTEHARRVIANEIAMQRWGEIHEIAGAALYLASDASSYVTGTVLMVDGGWTAH
jgi:NAD(P)-dependent dehydrogenase (short-subunit alcohol dehydrogenase family)